MKTNNSGAELIISTIFTSSAFKLEETNEIIPFTFEASRVK